MHRSPFPAARTHGSTWVLAALAFCTFLPSLADGSPQTAGSSRRAEPPRAPSFAPPVRLQAGSELMGIQRLYPSPVLHDMNDDGRVDIVLGDLWGAVTIAPGLAGDGVPTWGVDAALKASDGNDLKFSNW